MKKIIIFVFAIALFAAATISAHAATTIPSGYTKPCPLMDGLVNVRVSSSCPDPLKKCTIGTTTFWIQTTRNCPVL